LRQWITTFALIAIGPALVFELFLNLEPSGLTLATTIGVTIFASWLVAEAITTRVRRPYDRRRR